MRFHLLLALPLLLLVPTAFADFQAGAAVVDITPEKLPVLVNGGMLSRYVDKIHTRVNARALVLRSEDTQVALVVVDSCMMGREMLDEVKKLAEAQSGIPAHHLLISATHAHSAPASMGCLGTDADPNYVPFLKQKILDAIAQAQKALQPAKVGFTKINAADFTALRQWIRRPDRLTEDPFGNLTVRANMHAGRKWDEAVGESGPEDPDLSFISFQSQSGKPLAVLGNFSMHYFGDKDISADYFGLFAEGLKQRIAPEGDFVGILSHGCSGDIYRNDYTLPEKDRPNPTILEYTEGLLKLAMQALEKVRYRDDVDLAMAEIRMTLAYRTPDKQRLEWAKRVVQELGDRLSKTPTEVYAREQIILHERQKTEIVVQALRIGDIGIATTPNETYAITGLKIKAASPLPHNIVIELANGGDGYIPPPEMHAWGGYNTWPARSAGLEVMAEPKITQAAIHLLEKVSAKPRKAWHLGAGEATRSLLALKPTRYWRLNEFTGPVAEDASGHARHAAYETSVAYYLEGPHSAAFADDAVNRAPHFVGGRLASRLEGEPQAEYTISLWFWNGMPTDAREITGWIYSRDANHGLSAYGEHLGLDRAGHLLYLSDKAHAGKSATQRWTWHHATLVREGDQVRVYLDGKLEIETEAKPAHSPEIFFAGRSDRTDGWEGRLDEIAVFDRVLNEEEIAKLQVR